MIRALVHWWAGWLLGGTRALERRRERAKPAVSRMKPYAARYVGAEVHRPIYADGRAEWWVLDTGNDADVVDAYLRVIEPAMRTLHNPARKAP